MIIGILVSRMLTNPLRRITGTAKQIRDGDLSARTGLKGDDEIDRLGETFDEMATSLEKDLKHERRITSDVAHELRTPVMAMLATVEAMQDGVLPTDDEHLETVASETRRLSRLVQQMLDLSRMENRTAPLKLERIDTVSFVRRIVDSQQQLFSDHDLRLRFSDDTQGRPSDIEADPDMVTQAVVNLMSNAMRYTPKVAGSWCRCEPLAATCRSSCPIRASASPRKTFRASSGASGERMRAARARRAAWALAFRSPNRSSSATTATSRSNLNLEKVRRLRFICPVSTR